ncbi:MAG: DUF123 domain-containing protein [Saprospiraceae bacterium]
MNKGAYILLLHLTTRREVQAGKLGRFLFEKGWYAYVGSAMNNLDARIARHLKKEKKLHWHIDYLRQVASVEQVLRFESGDKRECQLSRKVAALADATPVKKFGASDCGCFTHLYFFYKNPDLESVR